MSYMKSYGTAAKGNDRLLKQYGGNAGSSPMARQRYAKGGAVKAGNPSLDEGLSAAAEGAPAKPSLARPGRKMPGKGGAGKKGGKTNVNVIIAQAPPKGDGMPMPPPGAGPSGPPMPMPPPGPGGPPMPMRANGGRIANLGKYAHGGKVTTKGDEASKIAKKETHGAEPYARGGKVNSDAAEDKAMMAKMVHKHEEHDHKGQKLTKFREGGPVMGLKNSQGGAGGAAGRLAKVKMYGK